MSFKVALNFEDGVTRVIECNDGETIRFQGTWFLNCTQVTPLHLSRMFHQVQITLNHTTQAIVVGMDLHRQLVILCAKITGQRKIKILMSSMEFF